MEETKFRQKVQTSYRWNCEKPQAGSTLRPGLCYFPSSSQNRLMTALESLVRWYICAVVKVTGFTEGLLDDRLHIAGPSDAQKG